MAQLVRAEQPLPRLYLRYEQEPSRRRLAGSLMDSILEGTGRAQLQAVDSDEDPASAWINDLWETAACSRSEAVRGAMPEQLLDRALAEPRSLQAGDLDFLLRKAVASEAMTWEATSSIRILATLLEDNQIERRPALDALIDATRLPDPKRRLAAVEGLWQADAVEALDVLEEALGTEEVQSIRSSIEHVVRVLRGLGTGGP